MFGKSNGIESKKIFLYSNNQLIAALVLYIDTSNSPLLPLMLKWNCLCFKLKLPERHEPGNKSFSNETGIKKRFMKYKPGTIHPTAPSALKMLHEKL